MNRHVRLFAVAILFSCNCYIEKTESKITDMLKEETDISFFLTPDLIQTSLDWDQLLILPPYGQLNQIEKNLNFDMGCVSQNALSYDHLYTICLINEKECVGYFSLSREIATIHEDFGDVMYLLYDKEVLNLQLTRKI